MTNLVDAFTETRNAMIKALLQIGVDPLVTGALMAHSERVAFQLARTENRLARLEKKVTRQDTRQKGQKRQEPTAANVVQFPKVKATVPVLSGA
jgi:hypothetical protein